MAEVSFRPSYAIPSIDQKDQPDTQPVSIDGAIEATITGDVSLDDTGIINEISLVLAALIAGIPVTVAGQPVLVTTTNPSTDVSMLATQATLIAVLDLLTARVPTEQGTWDYAAGINGSVPIVGRVLTITAVALGAQGTFTIDGGDTITLAYDSTDKASSSITIEARGNLIDPTIVFDSSIDAYFIQYLT